MFPLTIKLRGGKLPRPEPAELARINQDAALGAAVVVRRNFVRLARASGSRNFWHGAAALTQVEPAPLGNGMQIAVRQRGVRLRWKGGRVLPTGKPSAMTGRPTRALLIPFEDSPLRKRRVGLRELGIQAERIHVIKSRSGCPLLVASEGLKTKTKLIWLGKLVRSTTHTPNPGVLPAAEKMREAAGSAARKAIITMLKNKKP